MQPTQPLGRALRRLALTTKQANKGFYKGTGSGSMGSHTKWGGYKIDWEKVRTYKVPDLADFPVRRPPSPTVLLPTTTSNCTFASYLSIALFANHILHVQLTPFVARNIEVQKATFKRSSPMSGSDYLARWKAEGGTS